MFSTLFIALALSFTVSAESFEEGQAEFKKIGEDYALAAEPVLHEANSNIRALESTIAAKQAEKDACTTFDCAQRLSGELHQLELTLNARREQLRVDLIAVEDVFEAMSKELVIRTAIQELKAAVMQDTRFTLFTDKGLTECPTADVSRRSHCKQMNFEFKYDKEFYRVSILIGITMRFRDGNGMRDPNGVNRQPVLLVDAENLFYDDRALMQNLTPEVLVANSAKRVYREGSRLVMGTFDKLGWATVYFAKY